MDLKGADGLDYVLVHNCPTKQAVEKFFQNVGHRHRTGILKALQRQPLRFKDSAEILLNSINLNKQPEVTTEKLATNRMLELLENREPVAIRPAPAVPIKTSFPRLMPEVGKSIRKPAFVTPGQYALAEIQPKDRVLFENNPKFTIIEVSTVDSRKENQPPYLLVHNYPNKQALSDFVAKLNDTRVNNLLCGVMAQPVQFSTPTNLLETASWLYQKYGDTLDVPPMPGKEICEWLNNGKLACNCVPDLGNMAELGKGGLAFPVEVETEGKKWDVTIHMRESKNGFTRGLVTAVSTDASRTQRPGIKYKWPTGVPPQVESTLPPYNRGLDTKQEWAAALPFLDAAFKARAIKMSKENNLASARSGTGEVTGAYISQLIKKGHIRKPHPWRKPRTNDQAIREGSLVNPGNKLSPAEQAAHQVALDHVNNFARTYAGEISQFKPALETYLTSVSVPVLVGKPLSIE